MGPGEFTEKWARLYVGLKAPEGKIFFLNDAEKRVVLIIDFNTIYPSKVVDDISDAERLKAGTTTLH